MFGNEMQGDNPVCPLCEIVCEPDGGKTTGMVNTPKGLFIVHKTCVDKFNLLTELGL